MSTTSDPILPMKGQGNPGDEFHGERLREVEKWGQADYFRTTVNNLILLIFSASNRIGSLAPFLRFGPVFALIPKQESLPRNGKAFFATWVLPGRKGFSREEGEKESARGGQVSLAEKLRCRIRYLTDGAVFGRAAFVDQIFATNRAHFGRNRTSGARRMRGGDWGEMRVLRDLQRE